METVIVSTTHKIGYMNRGEGIWAEQNIFNQRQEVIWTFGFQIPSFTSPAALAAIKN